MFYKSIKNIANYMCTICHLDLNILSNNGVVTFSFDLHISQIIIVTLVCRIEEFI